MKGFVNMAEDKQNNKFVLIKLKEGTPIYQKAKEKLDDGDFKYFGIRKNNYSDIKRGLILYCNDEIKELHWCECALSCDEKGDYLVFKPLYSSSSKVVIMNACDSIFLDIDVDFEDRYITAETSQKLFLQFSQLEKLNDNFVKDVKDYKTISNESALHKLAQKNEYCKRQYDLKEPTKDGRSEYQRDYDRIIYSKSYRRMVDKTQVFSASKGDHYRTRMTHTMIVCQIARSICNALHFNQSLTEAIAIAHDLGHTPFGHIGERTLHDILSERFPEAGGFKHNYQGLRVVSNLEKAYYEIDGLDLSFQVMEGLFKHTGQKGGIEISEFADDEDLIEYLHLEKSHSITVEGQIVAIADEIAQRSHDIDDAFASDLLSFDEFLSYLKLSKFEDLAKEIKEIEERKKGYSNKIISDNNELFSFQISSAIVKYFINDVINASQIKIDNYLCENEQDFNASHIINDELIVFSDKGELICDYLKKMLNNKVLNSNEVSISDQNASVVVESLFNAYYDNPKLLHKGTKRKIYKDFINSKDDIHNIIDLIDGSQNAIKLEFANICNADADSDEYKKKQKILVRDICDYISGMTDTYANAQYEKICKTIYKK